MPVYPISIILWPPSKKPGAKEYSQETEEDRDCHKYHNNQHYYYIKGHAHHSDINTTSH